MRLPALLLATAALAAADRATDLRVQLGSYPGLRSVSYEAGNAASPDYAIRDRSGGALEVLASHAFASGGEASPFIQVGLAIRGFTGKDEAGWDHTVDAVGALVGGGVAWRPSDRFALEFGPALTIGSATAHEEFAGAKADSNRGSYASVDLRAGAWWTIRRFQLGTVVGIAAESASVHQPDHPGFGNTAVDATYRGSGGFILIGLGVRL